MQQEEKPLARIMMSETHFEGTANVMSRDPHF